MDERRHAMRTNEFSYAVSIDMAPRESLCEWCGKPATQQITALGGLHHNQGARFCVTCGLEFIRIITEATTRAKAPESALVHLDCFTLCEV
jgi:hypothetical protein